MTLEFFYKIDQDGLFVFEKSRYGSMRFITHLPPQEEDITEDYANSLIKAILMMPPTIEQDYVVLRIVMDDEPKADSEGIEA